MRIFVLDDDAFRLDMFFRNFREQGETAALLIDNFDKAVETVNVGPKYDIMYLDHDLCDYHYDNLDGNHERTGYMFVRHLLDNVPKEKWPDLVIVHSWNPGGGARMVAALYEAGIAVVREHFNGDSGKRFPFDLAMKKE